MSVMFLLGAGASVDSGMRTYRGGDNRYYTFDENDETNPLLASGLGDASRMEAMWAHLAPIKRDMDAIADVGPTYRQIERIAHDYAHAMIVTQNIDGLAHRVCDNVVEMHGNLSTATCLRCAQSTPLELPRVRCKECDGWLRPDVTLFDESLPVERVERVFSYIARHHPSTLYVVGTSMRFGYLHAIVKKAKARGATVVHVNNDPDYVWHKQRQQWIACQDTGEVRSRMVAKKKPEQLIAQLLH